MFRCTLIHLHWINTLCKKEKLLTMSNFSIYCNVFNNHSLIYEYFLYFHIYNRLHQICCMWEIDNSYCYDTKACWLQLSPCYAIPQFYQIWDGSKPNPWLSTLKVKLLWQVKIYLNIVFLYTNYSLYLQIVMPLEQITHEMLKEKIEKLLEMSNFSFSNKIFKFFLSDLYFPTFPKVRYVKCRLLFIVL